MFSFRFATECLAAMLYINSAIIQMKPNPMIRSSHEYPGMNSQDSRLPLHYIMSRAGGGDPIFSRVETSSAISSLNGT